MSQIPVITEHIRLHSKRDVLRLHLYTKFLENSIKATNTELDVLMELYDFGGFQSKEEERDFFASCIDKGYRNTDQSVRNVLAKFTKNGVLDRPKLHHRSLKESFIPSIDSEIVGLKYSIINAAGWEEGDL